MTDWKRREASKLNLYVPFKEIKDQQESPFDLKSFESTEYLKDTTCIQDFFATVQMSSDTSPHEF